MNLYNPKTPNAKIDKSPYYYVSNGYHMSTKSKNTAHSQSPSGTRINNALS